MPSSKRYCELTEDQKKRKLEIHKQYRNRNRDRLLEQKRQQYQQHRNEIRVSQRQYRQEHHDQIIKQQRRYYLQHHDEISQYHQQYRKDHRDEKREYSRRYNQEHLTCRGCGLNLTRRSSKLCATCDPTSATRRRYDENRPEIRTLRAVQAAFPQAIIYHDTPIGTACGMKERPDIYFVRDWIEGKHPVWVVVEVDERGHSGYGTTCEWKRVFNIPSMLTTTGADFPTLFIRFNPGTTVNVLQKRLPLLLETIRTMPFCENDAVSVAFLYYKRVYGNDLYLMERSKLEEQLKLFTPHRPSSSTDSD